MRKLKFRVKNSTIFHIKKNLSHGVGTKAGLHLQFDDKQLFALCIGLKNSSVAAGVYTFDRRIVHDIVNRYAADRIAQKYKIAVT